jgi:diguanylate cyclase (GGDEF)-like protein
METLIEGGSDRSLPNDLSPRLLVITGREPGKSIDINPGRQILGRESDCAIQLLDPCVSRHHAVIDRDPHGAVTVQNLSATNGTHVNDDKIDTVRLNNGDIIRIGNVVLKYLEPGTMEAELFQRVYQLAIQDALTETLSKTAVAHHLESLILNETEPFSVVLMDLDHFKLVNDTYGHIAGDVVLNRVAHIVKDSALRPGDLIGRFGGEEFLMLLPKTDAAEAGRVAERMRAAIEGATIVAEGTAQPIRVTASFGVAELAPAEGTDEQTARILLEAADKALYLAKNEGRNLVRVAGRISCS